MNNKMMMGHRAVNRNSVIVNKPALRLSHQTQRRISSAQIVNRKSAIVNLQSQIKKACPKKSWPLLTYEKHLFKYFFGTRIFLIDRILGKYRDKVIK